MLWSIDGCQNRVSADKYHLSVSRAQVSTHRGWVFFEVLRWQVTSFEMIARSSFILFLKLTWNMLCLCAAQLKFWFQTDLGRENSASYYRQGRQLLLTFLTMVTRWSRSTSNFFCSDWSKSDRWVHAGNLCSILKLVYFDSWSWQRFVSTCDVFANYFSLKSLCLFLKSHECALKLTDLWNTSLLFDLNYKIYSWELRF